MSLRDLLLLYSVIGVACAIAVVRRAEGTGMARAMSALLMVPLWPLWGPFALSTPSPARRRSRGASPDDSAARDPATRIARALDEAVEAVAGTPMSEVFSKQVAARIAAEVARIAVRMEELAELATRGGFDTAASAARVKDLESRGAPDRTVATARLQHESLSRLDKLRAADGLALEELADLLEVLRAQLLLARYAGSSAEGAGAIVSEVWARLEGLGAAFDVGEVDLAPERGVA
jgi:hypothetical protein